MTMKNSIYNLNWFQRSLRQIKAYFRTRRLVHEGTIYHHHMNEIVVSKRELRNQLLYGCVDYWQTLLRLLTYGKDCPDYETTLLVVSLKFWHLGRLVYPKNKVDSDKLDHKDYAYWLFQGQYETFDEVKEHIGRFHKESVSDELARLVFQKLLFVINTCCPLMADKSEVWCYHTYYSFIEYAIEHDDLGIPECDNMWDAYPKRGIPRGSVRSYLLKNMPEEFAEKVCHTNYHGFRFDEIMEGL